MRRRDLDHATIDFEPQDGRATVRGIAPNAAPEDSPLVRIPMPSLALPGAAAKIRERAAEPLPLPAPPPAEEPRREPPMEALSAVHPTVTAQSAALGEPIDKTLALLTEPYSARADAYRSLRRKLAASGNPRLIGVTSAGPAEGKTTLACNLSLALRESARGRVLLLEANHHAPALARILGFAPPRCFLEQLARHMEVPGAPWIAAEPLPRWHVIAIDPTASHDPLLDSVAFCAGIAQLKQAAYDYIIVDSPPVLGSADCNVIADAVDSLIFAALPMKSKRRAMRRAVEQLDPAPVLGVVVLDA